MGGTDTQVSLENLPAGVYTVRAFPATAGRWLRTEGKLLTEVPWVFAVPTGATKVTVYWDALPGATGYRVRWGAQSGNYPFSSAYLPATPGTDVYRYTVVGLTSEVEYFFVVEAEYNGLWGPPSVEDSAVPHVGAIPWDTQDPNQIISAVRARMGSPYGYLIALSPEGLLYEEEEWGAEQHVSTALYFYNPDLDAIVDTYGAVVQPTQNTGGGVDNTGPYRRVVTLSNQCKGAEVYFYVPPPIYATSQYIYVQNNTNTTTRDTPYVYLGIRGGTLDIEAGIAFHPAGRGRPGRDGGEYSDPDRQTPPPSYNRWQPYLKVYDSSRKTVNEQPAILEDMQGRGVLPAHIRYDDAYYGLIVRLYLVIDKRNKEIMFHGDVWSATLDDPQYDPPRKLYRFYQSNKVNIQGGAVRRVISIAQRKDWTGTNGYQTTGSFFLNVGIGYQTLFDVGDLPNDGAIVFCPPTSGIWTSGTSTNFPNNTVVRVQEMSRYNREAVSIDLRRR